VKTNVTKPNNRYLAKTTEKVQSCIVYKNEKFHPR